MGKFSAGAGNINWKGGTTLNDVRRRGDYIRVCAGTQRDRYVHVMLMEASLGRELEKWEQVEHVNGDTTDNTYLPRMSETQFGNLRLTTMEEHPKLTRERLRRGENNARSSEIESSDT